MQGGRRREQRKLFRVDYEKACIIGNMKMTHLRIRKIHNSFHRDERLVSILWEK